MSSKTSSPQLPRGQPAFSGRIISKVLPYTHAVEPLKLMSRLTIGSGPCLSTVMKVRCSHHTIYASVPLIFVSANRSEPRIYPSNYTTLWPAFSRAALSNSFPIPRQQNALRTMDTISAQIYSNFHPKRRCGTYRSPTGSREGGPTL
jgi:hypothetical protein